MTTEMLMGSIVAFEGKPDLVLTQLRLLPTSPQLLILPSVESYMKLGDEEYCFDARGFIRQVHDALVARNDAARDFLNGSTADHKRLVFLNGSTPGAQTLCIKEIMKHKTDGDRVEAEAIYEDIVKDGLAGLHKPALDLDMRAHDCLGYSNTPSDDELFQEDPITKAMRAADALDRQTANLQPSNDLALNLISRPRSSSLPLYGYFDEFEDSTPFYVFGVRPSDDESITGDVVESMSAPATPNAIITDSEPNTLETPRFGPVLPSPSIYPASCIGESYGSAGNADQTDIVVASPGSEEFSLRSDQIVLGEASVLDMRLSVGRSSISRVRSLDRIYPASPKLRDLGISLRSWLDEPDTPKASQVPHSATWLSGEKGWRLSRMSIIERPRTVVVRSRLSTVQMRPVPVCKKRKQAKKSLDVAKPNYIDRGTDARESKVEKLAFGPVLPAVEDLVVFFKDDNPDALLGSAVNAFRNRRYPQLSFSPTTSNTENVDKYMPGTPTQPSPKSGDKISVCLKESDPSSPGTDDYDPFAYTQPSWQPSKPSDLVATVSIVHLPTPARTPPPTTAGDSECKIHEFQITSSQTAVSVQNSLRSILGEYFPPDTEGYRQFQLSLLPEFDELWKPMFRGASPQRNDGNGPQILAIGSQKGVQSEYSQAVTGRLEKVGRKSCEIVKTGRVDFRYLLANAMQAFTAQRLTNQTGNPFTNSYLLATLIIPHLETYLTLHTDVRYLLLMYPPEHLATVLALQKLIGVDVMKVAQIVDSASKEDSPFTHIRGASINSKAELKSTRPPFSTRSSSDIAVSKANYLLTSTASERDIATFVSTVWNMEIEDPKVSAPEPVTGKPKRKQPSPPHFGLKNEHVAGHLQITSQGSPSTPSVVPAPSSRGLAAPPPVSLEPSSPAASLRAPSFAETIRTLKSIKSKRSQSKLRNKNAPQVEAESLPGFEYVEDSEDDMDERRLMPVFMQKHVIGKPNSRKALKFLGLA